MPKGVSAYLPREPSHEQRRSRPRPRSGSEGHRVDDQSEKLVNTKASCAALAGYVVDLWHCDRDGSYSLYGASIGTENYLRGVQEADANGTVTFTTIFPAAYSGRWPHIHFEIYPSLDKVASSSNKIATSQLALPKTACDAVYATTGYGASVSNLAQSSLATDNVFSDASSQQLATVTGDVTNEFTATLTVGVAA